MIYWLSVDPPKLAARILCQPDSREADRDSRWRLASRRCRVTGRGGRVGNREGVRAGQFGGRTRRRPKPAPSG